jgi:hypothetical protein
MDNLKLGLGGVEQRREKEVWGIRSVPILMFSELMKNTGFEFIAVRIVEKLILLCTDKCFAKVVTDHLPPSSLSGTLLKHLPSVNLSQKGSPPIVSVLRRLLGAEQNSKIG